MNSKAYEYCLSITSQFYFCGLPLRLDTYSSCLFNCVYCFARARGGNSGPRRLAVADVSAIDRRLERLRENPPRSVVDEMLAEQQPIHFGGMSDPFIPAELQIGASLEAIRVLAKHKYPTVISTKGRLFEREEYLQEFKRGRFIVQASLSSMDENLLSRVDLGTPGPRALLRALSTVAAEGISTACRIQPLLPTRESDAFEVIDACAQAGVKHVAVEHLKLPIEKEWRGTSLLCSAIELDVSKYFNSKKAQRVGREWILPVEERLERVLALKRYAHGKGLTFGAADNDLLLFSDGQCCCSGIDLASGFRSFFRFNYTEAARRGITNGRISIHSLDGVWCPDRSLARYVNSHSRLRGPEDSGAGIRDYIRHNWNGSSNGNSPQTLYGITSSDERDENGFRVYTFGQGVRALLRENNACGTSC